MDYLYFKVEDASFPLDTVERRAFAAHLKLVAKALHDVEWVDSGDYGPGHESAAIRACLTPAVVLEHAVKEARQAQVELTAEIARATAGEGTAL
jgi:hypothetical protein